MGTFEATVKFGFEHGTVTFKKVCATFAEVRRWCMDMEKQINMVVLYAETDDGRRITIR